MKQNLAPSQVAAVAELLAFSRLVAEGLVPMSQTGVRSYARSTSVVLEALLDTL